MRRYRTEITVPADRCVILHLPMDVPVGRASLTIEVAAAEPRTSDQDWPRLEDHSDMEWWDEFSDDADQADPDEVRSLDERLADLLA